MTWENNKGCGSAIPRNFPVFSLLAGNFARRTVSARLRAPPRSLECREPFPPFSARYAEYAHFRDTPSTNWAGENGLAGSKIGHLPKRFSGRQMRSPVSQSRLRRMQCDHKPWGLYNRLTLTAWSALLSAVPCRSIREDAFKSEHPPAPHRARLFPPDRSVRLWNLRSGRMWAKVSTVSLLSAKMGLVLSQGCQQVS